MAENTTLQIRVSVENKEKIKQLAKEKGYRDTTEYIIDMCCNDNKQSCNDISSNNSFGDDYSKLYYDLLPKYNHLNSLLDARISIFDDDFTCWCLGSFLWNVDFMDKFRKQYSKEWKNDDTFERLLTQLKKVYHLGYDAEQKLEIESRGHLKIHTEEFRAIPNEDDLLIERDV